MHVTSRLYNTRLLDGWDTFSQASRIGQDLVPDKAYGATKAKGPLVLACHGEPGAWSVPNFEWGSLNNLQPGQAFLVGRTMLETDRLSPEHERRCNAMDEILGPTEFHRQVACGSRVESVDVDFLNPYGAAFGIADVWAGLLRGQDCDFSFLSSDCFVLPSRGEGWERPHVEAMSMGLPVIATCQAPQHSWMRRIARKLRRKAGQQEPA
ncbi:hypothetical protein WJX82_003821 [Trebouxia sp. C0006]